MGTTKAILKAIIAYYIAQITILHLYMVFVRSPSTLTLTPTPITTPATPSSADEKVMENPEPEPEPEENETIATPEPEPEPEPEPVPEPVIITKTVIKHVDVEKVRDHLTQEQLQRLHQEINGGSSADDDDDDDGFSSSLREARAKLDQLTQTIQHNLDLIERKNQNLPVMIDEQMAASSHSDPNRPTLDLRSSKKEKVKNRDRDEDDDYYYYGDDDDENDDNDEDPSLEYILEDMDLLLSEESFESYSDKDLSIIFGDIIEDLSQLKHYGSLGFDSLSKSKGDKSSKWSECNKFLAREVTLPKKKKVVKEKKATTSKDDSKYVTPEQLEQYMTGIRAFVKALHDDPLRDMDDNDNFDQALAADFKRLFQAEETKIQSRVEYLESYAEEISELSVAVEDSEDDDDDDEEEEDDTSASCVEKRAVVELWEEAKAAMMTGDNVTFRLKELVGAIDPSVVVKDLGPISSATSKSDERRQSRTLRQVIETPLYPKIIERIDQAVEFVAGYNDMVDQVIDYIGGKEEDGGSVGKNLEKNLNRLLQKIEIPDDFEDLRRRMDFEGFKRKLGLEK